MLKRFSCLAVLLLFLPGAALAQLGLPGVPLPTGGIDRVIDRAVGTVEPVVFSARELTQLRAARIEKLVRSNPKLLELTTDGYPARRGEILMFEPSEPALSGLRILGFRVLEREAIEGLDLPVTRLQLPPGVRMREVSALMDRAAPGVRWTPDHVYEQAGRAPGAADLKAEAAPISARVGVIDGAPGENQRVAASKGFARGAPTPSSHGSAVVSLLRRAGVRSIAVADVYGTDPAGGSATAVARALGWLVADGAKVITMSLVGADNLLLSRAVTAARGKGVVIVAPVGNDGPASPYAYPASYPGVVAVTGVDGRNRALIEAGRALDLDYAAPAADMTGSDARGRRIKLRGTSFAAPLAAARIAAAIGGDWRAATDNEAIDLGKRGADSVYGRGLLCGKCR